VLLENPTDNIVRHDFLKNGLLVVSAMVPPRSYFRFDRMPDWDATKATVVIPAPLPRVGLMRFTHDRELPESYWDALGDQ
jgi:hypothetical protein